MFGIDEAGKGPVLGSMFAAAVRVADARLLPAGIDDSKRLAPEQRQSIAAELRDDDRVAVAVAEIPVARIDDPETDMNTLTVTAHAEAAAGVVGDPAVAGDGAGAHGADEEHAVVGAASIVAKVARDAHVADLADQYAETYGEPFGDLGSGYPSDPNTREFLETFVAEHGRLPDCARRSWSTCEDVLAEHQQSGLADF
ncbi:ribonuclease HII [Halobacteriales archaeon SW_6_65_15]|nr:MAG: ribonuclease HII [Halobacteriales archaeon SW_6_65_15]